MNVAKRGYREAQKQIREAVKTAEAVRERAVEPSGSPECGKWEKAAAKARLALAKAEARTKRSAKKGWKMGKSPSSSG